jgi:hypothetical protein
MDLGDGDDVSPYDDQLQLQKYQQIFPIFWEHPSVVGVTLWGSLQDKMWQKTTHLINSDGTWRPALKWMAQYIKDTPVTIDLKEVKSHTSYYEAECANVGSSWKLIADTLASNGNYVTAKAGLESPNAVSPDVGSYITIPVSVDTTGVFGIFARVNCPSTNDDSFWLKLNNGQFRKISGLTTTGWNWKLLSNLTLNKGDNLLTIAYCEDGAMLDKLCVSNYIFPPSGMGSEALNKCDTTAVGNPLISVRETTLGQNYPNPFTQSTQINFSITEPTHVSLQVFDIVGKLVATLVNEELGAGNYNANWNAVTQQGSKIKSGTYIYRLVAGNRVVTNKMLFFKQ